MDVLTATDQRDALVAIQAAIRSALSLCDSMGLSMVGIHLDGARLEVEAELERCGFGDAIDPTPIALTDVSELGRDAG